MSDGWKADSLHRGEEKPSVYKHYTGAIVHRHIHYGSDVWLLSCRELGIDKRVLKSAGIGAAKNEAAAICIARSRSLAERFSAASFAAGQDHE